MTAPTATLTALLLLALVVGLAASITLSEAALAVLAAVILVERRGALGTLAWPLRLPVCAFAVWTLVSAASSQRPLESLYAAKSLLALGGLYVLTNALADGAGAQRFATRLLAAIGIVATLAVVQVALCPAAGAVEGQPVLGWFFRKCDRARGFYSIYMTLGGVLTLVLVSTLPRLVRVDRAARWAVAAWTAGVVALGLTLVRGAWIGFAAGALACLPLVRRRGRAAAALATVLLLLAVVPAVRDRVRTIGDVTDPTTRDRLAMLHAGALIARDHPVTGVGPGQVKHVYPSYAPPEALRRSRAHLHNTPLQILVERGVPGLLLWLGIFASFFVRARRILRRLSDAPADRALVQGSVAAIAAFLVGGLFEYNFGDSEVLLVAVAVMALPFVIERGVPPERHPA